MPNAASRVPARRFTTALSAALGAALLGSALVPIPAFAAEGPRVVINEAYLKGGSNGAFFNKKFVELYNAGDTAQDLSGWSLQYRSASSVHAPTDANTQPLTGSKDKAEPGASTIGALAPAALGAKPQRRRLPEDRVEVGRKFRVGEYEGYIHVGLYDDGTPGDIFVDIAKDGTTMAGLMNSLMIAVSMGLQYGVPPEVYVSKLSHMRFEPSGLTNDADIRNAKSIVDYIFRWFGKKFLTVDQQEEAGILSADVKARLAERYANGDALSASEPGTSASEPGTVALDPPPPGQTALFNSWEDAVECAKCGGRMVRTGSCYTCRDCGTNTGCS